jgi:hypothetical protein
MLTKLPGAKYLTRNDAPSTTPEIAGELDEMLLEMNVVMPEIAVVPKNDIAEAVSATCCCTLPGNQVPDHVPLPKDVRLIGGSPLEKDTTTEPEVTGDPQSFTTLILMTTGNPTENVAPEVDTTNNRVGVQPFVLAPLCCTENKTWWLSVGVTVTKPLREEEGFESTTVEIFPEALV